MMYWLVQNIHQLILSIQLTFKTTCRPKELAMFICQSHQYQSTYLELLRKRVRVSSMVTLTITYFKSQYTLELSYMTLMMALEPLQIYLTCSSSQTKKDSYLRSSTSWNSITTKLYLKCLNSVFARNLFQISQKASSMWLRTSVQSINAPTFREQLTYVTNILANLRSDSLELIRLTARLI